MAAELQTSRCCCRIFGDGYHCRLCHDHNGIALPEREPAVDRRGVDRRRGPVAGVDLIAAERRRQIDSEGYSADHDRGQAEELVAAAVCYAQPARHRPLWGDNTTPMLWPWSDAAWKPVPDDRVRELVKAGALLAAAIDAALDATSQSDKHGGAAPEPSDPDPLTHWIDDGCPGGHRV